VGATRPSPHTRSQTGRFSKIDLLHFKSRGAEVHWTAATLGAKLPRRSFGFEDLRMRIGVLLVAVLLSVAPAFARGGHRGGHSRSSSGTRSYSSRSYSSHSSHSSYRSHSGHQPSSASRSYRTPSYSRHTSTYGTGQRDSHGRLMRSAAATDSFKRQHPCPSTGRSSGACPGYIIDHVKPLANGGADAPSNMQWQTTQAAKEKDKWERKR
jgi:hypothetical protein